MRHRLEFKLIAASGEDPEEYSLESDDRKFHLLVFRGNIEGGMLNDLVNMASRSLGHPCTGIVLGPDDKFEVYAIEIPTRFEREPVI